MALGLLGRKLGMSQINDDERGRVPVTLVEVGPCLILQKKTPEKDGYAAIKLAFGERKAKRTNKSMKGNFDKVKATPRRWMREFRIDAKDLGNYEEGQEVSLLTLQEVFQAGKYVDVAGRTKGRGFTGVVKKWGMKGNRRTHGTHEFFRHGGSIGTRTWPGWVHKGKKMGGHYGDDRVTTSRLRIVRVVPEKNCLLILGAIPGANTGLLEVHPSR